MKIILNELIVAGATQKLEELNKEREYLIKLIDKFSKSPIPRIKQVKRVHWTQTPNGRKRMREIAKRRYAKSI